MSILVTKLLGVALIFSIFSLVRKAARMAEAQTENAFYRAMDNSLAAVVLTGGLAVGICLIAM